MKSLQLLLTSSVLVLMLLVKTSSVFAVENPFSLRVSPSFHDITLNESETTKEFATSLTNLSKQELTINLSVLDIEQIPPEGRIQFLAKKSKVLNSLQPYISFPENNIQLKPGETKNIVAKIDASTIGAGGYYGGIIFQADSQNSEKRSAVPAVSSLVFVTKAGEVNPSLSIRSIQELTQLLFFSPPQTFTVEFKNAGNIHLIPYGRVEVYDSFNRLVAKGILNESSMRILPQTTVNIDAQMKSLASNVPISIQKVVVYGQDSHALTGYRFEDTYLYINPLFLGTVIIIIGILIWKRNKIRLVFSSVMAHLKMPVIIKTNVK